MITNSIQSSGMTGNPSAVAKTPINPDVKKAAAGFEAFFLRQMMEDMRSASLGDGIFDSGATQNFQEMADAQMAENLSETGQFGIARMLEKQFSARLGVTPASGTAEQGADK